MHDSFGLSLIRHFRAIIFNVWNHLVWLRITDEGSLPEMRIWSILLIKSDLKWCIHLSRRLFSYIKLESTKMEQDKGQGGKTIGTKISIKIKPLNKIKPTTILSKNITSALTAVKYHVMQYSETAYSSSNVNRKVATVLLSGFLRIFFRLFYFYVYTSLPHGLIKTKLLSLVNRCFNRESKSYLCT